LNLNFLFFLTIAGLRYLGKEYLEPNIREKLLKTVQWMLLLLGVLFPFIFPLKPDNPNFIYSVIPESWNGFNVFLFFCVFETYNIARAIVFHLILAVSIFTHIFTLNFWLKGGW